MANYDLTYEGSRVQNILDTGDELRDAGYIFRGEATPSTVPGTPTERVAYIGGPGTYTNFGSSITVPSGSIGVFKYTGSAWSNQVIACTVPISTSVQNNDTTVPTGKAVKTAVDAEASARQLGDSTLQGGINTAMQAVNAINNAITNGSVYAGIATPSSTPASGKVFYLAFTAGTYTNYGGLEVPQGINILKNNGSTWLLDSFLGIDDAPTQGSANLVKSGGVLKSILQNGPAFDLSAYNAEGGVLATYADLSAALNALNAIPADFKKGGMSMKFVLSSDNKYVQYRLMKNQWSTTPSDWQGIDDEPTAGSQNLVESGGVNFALTGITEEHKYINKNANVESASYSQPFKYCLLEINEGDYIEVYNAWNQASGFWPVLIFNEDKTDILQITTVKGMAYYTTIPSGYKYLACNFSIDEQDFYIKVNYKIYNQNSFVINEDSNVRKITNIVKNVSNSLDFEDVANLTVLETKKGFLYDNGTFVSNGSFTTKVFDVRGLDFIHIPVFQGSGNNIQQVGFFTKTTLGASMVDRFMVQSPKYGIFPVIGYNYVTITSTNELIADVVIKKAAPINNKNAFDSYNGTRLGVIPKTKLDYYQEINGYIYANGQYTSNASWRIHAFKLLNQERYISVEGLRITGNNVLYAAFYNGSITSDGLVKGFNVNTSEDTIFEVPENATIFCISSETEGISNSAVYSFEMGNQFFNSNWKGKTALFYGDSVTEIGQYGDVVDGEMTYPYNTTAMGQNWQRRLCQALGIQKFYSRGIGSAAWEHSEYVAYVDSTKGFLVERPIPFVDFDDAPEREGCTKVHFGLSDFDRIQAQIPESIRTEIDLIFMFDHNSTISSFTPSFVTENVIDTYWMAYEGNPFGGDYNTIDPSNAVLSTIMKLQIWCPNAVIVIGTPLSGLGTAGQNTTDLTVSLDRQQTVNLTKEICQVMSIPCINVWGNDGINPLNRTQYITDGIHPYSITGAKAIARTLICGLNNVYPKI